jgi:hypothetical protein
MSGGLIFVLMACTPVLLVVDAARNLGAIRYGIPPDSDRP